MNTFANYGLLLLILYMIEVGVSFLSFRSLVIYFTVRWRIGSMSAFMFTLCIFCFCYGMQNIAAFATRLTAMYDIGGVDLTDLIFVIWVSSHIGSAISFTAISILIVMNRFDIQLRIGPRKKEENHDTYND